MSQFSPFSKEELLPQAEMLEIKKQKVSNINTQIIQHYVNQPYFEIKGSSDKIFNVKFFDEKNYCHYQPAADTGLYPYSVSERYYESK